MVGVMVFSSWVICSSALKRAQPSSDDFSIRSVWIAGGWLGRISGACTMQTLFVTDNCQASRIRK